METHSDLGQIIQSDFLNKELFNYCWIIWYPIETKIFFFHFDHDSNTDLVILLKLGCSLLINFDPIIQFWTLITFPIPKHQRERKNPDFYIQIQIRVIQLLVFTENFRPCRDLNPGPLRYQADMLPIELSWLGSNQLSNFFFFLSFLRHPVTIS